jgi:hypothetical protein
MPMFFGFGSLTAREICTTVLTPLGKQVAAALEPTP